MQDWLINDFDLDIFWRKLGGKLIDFSWILKSEVSKLVHLTSSLSLTNGSPKMMLSKFGISYSRKAFSGETWKTHWEGALLDQEIEYA